jgi:hypothetical protein
MHAPQPLEQLLSVGEVINQIPVDNYGMCRWVDVAVVELQLRQRSLDTIFEMQMRIDVLEEALRYISNRKVMDGVSAISMRAVAGAALRGVISS